MWVHILINIDKFTEVTLFHPLCYSRTSIFRLFEDAGCSNQRSKCFPQVEWISGVIKSLSLLAATSTSLSLVNEAQYLMINRASVELIQKLMSSRFEHMMCYSKHATLSWKTSGCVDAHTFTLQWVICVVRQNNVQFPHSLSQAGRLRGRSAPWHTECH